MNSRLYRTIYWVLLLLMMGLLIGWMATREPWMRYGLWGVFGVYFLMRIYQICYAVWLNRRNRREQKN